MAEGLYQRITSARAVLGVPEEAAWGEIEGRFKALLKEWHPDHGRAPPEECHRRTQSILEAYRVMREYCTGYRFVFTRQEVEKYLSPEEWWVKRFGCDPTWSGGQEEVE